ncbi:acetate/propionate family kinase [Buchnera aphidicola]|uniref:acetate/propionate family kinase n=1 Tax=Buchnera aphidicola TaxID=9 RepID=UPI0031B6E9D0
MSKKLVFVINSGSSSLKFSLIDSKSYKRFLTGIVECLYLINTNISWKTKNISIKNFFLKSYSTHENALEFIINNIIKKKIDIFNDIISVGHRVVHGGKKIKSSVIINESIMDIIKKASCFAPLHNSVNLLGIKLLIKILPFLRKKNVAVFDTSFYQRLPEKAYLYGIPYIFYKKYGIRRYGAHGISHSYIMKKTAEIICKDIMSINIISCHLGNGASVSVIKNGICIDTSMGLTPLEGLVMGTRSGDIDPSFIFYLYENMNMEIKEIKNLLTKKSGILGLSEETSDFRFSEKKYFSNKKAKRAVDIFSYKLVKYISSYFFLIAKEIDALVFTGGIGQNSVLVRKLTVSQLSSLGFELSEKFNNENGFKNNFCISSKKSIPILVVSTDEEIEIAKETIRLIN